MPENKAQEQGRTFICAMVTATEQLPLKMEQGGISLSSNKYYKPLRSYHLSTATAPFWEDLLSFL